MDMKKTHLVLMIIVLSSNCLYAQEAKSLQRNFGIGVSLFNLSEYLNESSFGNSIYLTINTKSNFRLEPTFGFIFSKSQSKYVMGLGAFKFKDFSNLRMLTGIRLGFSDGNVFTIAPSLGGEYYFSDHFSVGSEVQLRVTIENGDFTFLTNTLVLARFYF
jgi:hypothetical protein